MMRVLSSEWLKTKRSAIRGIVFFIPLLFDAAIIWYISSRGVSDNTQLLAFRMFFEAWTTSVVPMGTGILSGFLIHQEELAGSFDGILSSKVSRNKLYLGKFIFSVILMTISTAIAVTVFAAVLKLILGFSIVWSIYLKSAILTITATIPLLAICMWVSWAWGMGASIGISIGGLLLAALMATGLGDKVWQFIPWAWPVRLAELPGVPLARASLPPADILPGLINRQIAMGLLASGICLAAVLIGGIIWFKHWEGRRYYE
jgi:ABC-2 type transport system permease protein